MVRIIFIYTHKKAHIIKTTGVNIHDSSQLYFLISINDALPLLVQSRSKAKTSKC